MINIILSDGTRKMVFKPTFTGDWRREPVPKLKYISEKRRTWEAHRFGNMLNALDTPKVVGNTYVYTLSPLQWAVVYMRKLRF